MQDNAQPNLPQEGFNLLKYIVQTLVIIGALNWGLVGAFNFNLVSALFGISLLSKVVYIAVGIAGVIQALALVKTIAR